jgi:hypothetical protein
MGVVEEVGPAVKGLSKVRGMWQRVTVVLAGQVGHGESMRGRSRPGGKEYGRRSNIIAHRHSATEQHLVASSVMGCVRGGLAAGRPSGRVL